MGKGAGVTHGAGPGMVLLEGEGVPVRDSLSQEGKSEWTPASRREVIIPEELGKSILRRGSGKGKRPEMAPGRHVKEQRGPREAEGQGGSRSLARALRRGPPRPSPGLRTL